MAKGKDWILGGLVCASITFAGYSHTLASQRYTNVQGDLRQARVEMDESLQELGRLNSEVSTLRTALKQESQQREAAEKKLLEKLLAASSSVASQPTQEKKTVRFKDLEGIYAQTTIENLLKAGIVEVGDGEFRPDAPITRGEFLEWLGKSSNVQLPRDRQVRLASNGEATFRDVPANHPAFPYVQGAVNSGFVIGYDAETFRPERILSREEMIAIKVSFDKAKPQMNGNCNARYTDFEQVSQKYRQAVHNCDNSGYGSQTAAHIWGNIKTFRPQEEVTRSEAALCVERIKAKYGYRILGDKS